MLEPGEEGLLLASWAESGDARSLDRLVRSHMRLAVSLARPWARYGLDPDDLVAEAACGLVQAVRKFDPTAGGRLSTYAVYWIRKSLAGYVLANASPFPVPASDSARKLFFALPRHSRRQSDGCGPLDDSAAAAIAAELGVSVSSVSAMDRFLRCSASSIDADCGGAPFHLADPCDDPEEAMCALQESEAEAARVAALMDEMSRLGDRERDIVECRRLSEPPMTLESLSGRWKVTRERIRQIEVRTVACLRDRLTDFAEAA